MQLEYGTPDRPIWLIGDSNPGCADDVAHPLDPRHPSRHSIWTPVLDVIQDQVFPRRLRASGYHSDNDVLYIRNAVTDPAYRRDPEQVAAQVGTLRGLYRAHQPILVLSFGAFAFALCRRAFETDDSDAASVIAASRALSVRHIAAEFERRHRDQACKLLPLLHQSVARSFQHVDAVFRAIDNSSYYEYTGIAIAERLRQHGSAPIWMSST